MKTKTLKWLSLIVIAVLSAGFASCEDDGTESSIIDIPNTPEENITKPTIKKTSSEVTTTDLEVIFQVSNEDSPSVILHYGTSESNLSKTKTCRYYQYASKNYDYYKVSLTGFNSGTKIYFKGVATNSAGSSETPIYSHIIATDNQSTQDKPTTEPTTGVLNGHEYVDLGLSVKWATCNVGASKPEEYGDYYAWGETNEKSNYSFKTYEWFKWSKGILTKYCTESDYGNKDNKKSLDLEDDVAHVKWGNSWHIPTPDEIIELCKYCTLTWTTNSGVNGYKIKGPNGNIIFLPAAGVFDEVNHYDHGTCCFYWSNTLSEEYCFNAYHLDSSSDSGLLRSWINRYKGLPVRPVAE